LYWFVLISCFHTTPYYTIMHQQFLVAFQCQLVVPRLTQNQWIALFWGWVNPSFLLVPFQIVSYLLVKCYSKTWYITNNETISKPILLPLSIGRRQVCCLIITFPMKKVPKPNSKLLVIALWCFMYVYYIVYIPSYLHYIHITVNGWWYVYVYIYTVYIYISRLLLVILPSSICPCLYSYKYNIICCSPLMACDSP
jgi:hypothetical protein